MRVEVSNIAIVVREGFDAVMLSRETTHGNHGQFYVAISRVQWKEGLNILIHDKEGRPLRKTINMVYNEVFQNI
ncbi:hypothetical protein L6164_021053 [Bauhinia variegata]|uniref:Uncharacterized protein n=1 Tax=Bauhinia variegata TaxID=167791 RepID=A0ACB9MZ05_BAUVA|nr:hypothetical protein L6164_021053 [Bauhinia variegata]